MLRFLKPNCPGVEGVQKSLHNAVSLTEEILLCIAPDRSAKRSAIYDLLELSKFSPADLRLFRECLN